MEWGEAFIIGVAQRRTALDQQAHLCMHVHDVHVHVHVGLRARACVCRAVSVCSSPSGYTELQGSVAEKEQGSAWV